MKKLVNILGASTVLGLLSPAQAQVAPAWVSALQPGEWYEIPNTAMSTVEPAVWPSGNTGPQSKVVAWTSFVVDPRTSKVYSPANGGHQDYAGNEVDVLELEREQPLWAELLAPTADSQLTNGQAYYSDGRPAARHTYYGVVLYPPDDRIMLFGGAIWCLSGCGSNAVDSYLMGANAWSPGGTHPDLPGSGSSGNHALTIDPASGDVYTFVDGGVYKWSRATNGWSTEKSGTPVQGYGDMSAFDTSRRRILVIGNSPYGTNDHHIYTLADKSLTPITLSGTGAASMQGGGALLYVPELDRFLVRNDAAGATVFQIDPATFAVTTLTTSGGSTIPSTQNGPYNKFLYVPRLGGAVYVPSYDGNAWFVRLLPTDSVAPVPPRGVTVR